MNKSEIKQEIEYLTEEIGQDKCLANTSDFSGFHAERLAENREKLADYERILLKQYGETM